MNIKVSIKLSSKKFLRCGNGKKVKKSPFQSTKPSPTLEWGLSHTFADRMGRNTESLPQIVLQVLPKGRITNALPSAIFYEIICVAPHVFTPPILPCFFTCMVPSPLFFFTHTVGPSFLQPFLEYCILYFTFFNLSPHSFSLLFVSLFSSPVLCALFLDFPRHFCVFISLPFFFLKFFFSCCSSLHLFHA